MNFNININFLLFFPSSLFTTSSMATKDQKPVAQNEREGEQSQFQGLNEAVERNDDTGVMSIESLCMNCHENVCYS